MENIKEQNSQRIEIIEGLRRGFEKCKHYQSFTKRVEKVLQNELPQYKIYCKSDKYLESVKVWGCGLDFNNGVYLCWNVGKSWQDGFAQELIREDISDYIEREKDEEQFYVEFEQAEKQIIALRQRTKEMIETLPIPKSATLRNESFFWNKPSSKLEKMFPHLFGRIKE